MLSTQIRRIPFVFSVLVVLIITLLLCLALLRFSGVFAAGAGMDPNGVTNGSMINPDGVAGSPGVDPNGLASGCTIDPNGGSCQSHASGLLAAGVSIDGNGNT
jgi:subtilase family serine protease